MGGIYVNKSASAISIACIIIISCTKSVTYNGVVYSRHNIPLPNYDVWFGLGYGGKDLDDSYANTTTNSKGEFFCKVTLRHNGFLNSYGAKGDSGNAYGHPRNASGPVSISNMTIIVE